MINIIEDMGSSIHSFISQKLWLFSSIHWFISQKFWIIFLNSFVHLTEVMGSFFNLLSYFIEDLDYFLRFIGSSHRNNVVVFFIFFLYYWFSNDLTEVMGFSSTHLFISHELFLCLI